MNEYSFENAATDYMEVARCNDDEYFIPDADNSERITNGWLLRTADGDVITIVHYDGSVWCGLVHDRGRMVKAHNKAPSFLMGAEKPSDANHFLSVSVKDEHYFVEFNPDALGDYIQTKAERIRQHLESLLSAYMTASNKRHNADAAEHTLEAILAGDVGEILGRFDDDIPF